MEGLDGFTAGNSRTTNGTLASVLDQGPEVEMQTEVGGASTTKLAQQLHEEQELRAQAEADSEDKGRRLAVRPSLPDGPPPSQQGRLPRRVERQLPLLASPFRYTAHETPELAFANRPTVDGLAEKRAWRVRWAWFIIRWPRSSWRSTPVRRRRRRAHWPRRRRRCVPRSEARRRPHQSSCSSNSRD